MLFRSRLGSILANLMTSEPAGSDRDERVIRRLCDGLGQQQTISVPGVPEFDALGTVRTLVVERLQIGRASCRERV